MEKEKTSTLSNGMIWFGAAVSIAEIFTGTLLAPIGFVKGITAIILGHIIGCVLFYLAGKIGAETGKSAMETVKISFGSKGSFFFSFLNVLQLVGWTAVMIIQGARATGVIANPALHMHGEALWCIVIGVLIILWIFVDIQNLSKINVFIMGALFLVTIILSVIIFKDSSSSAIASGKMSFGEALELAVAMPLSWLPLISDYTKSAKQPKAATMSSAVTYFFTSCWMYIIGLGAAILTGKTDIAQIMMNAGLGLMGVFIVIMSTVTTTYLDAYSAGVSFASIIPKAKEKWTGIIVCVVGTLLAIFTPIEQYQNFLYLIGSVFAPMVAILIVDFFILKKDNTKQIVNITNIILWIVGFILYHLSMSVDSVVGYTLPVMVIISILCIIVNGVKNYVQKNLRKC